MKAITKTTIGTLLITLLLVGLIDKSFHIYFESRWGNHTFRSYSAFRNMEKRLFEGLSSDKQLIIGDCTIAAAIDDQLLNQSLRPQFIETSGGGFSPLTVNIILRSHANLFKSTNYLVLGFTPSNFFCATKTTNIFEDPMAEYFARLNIIPVLWHSPSHYKIENTLKILMIRSSFLYLIRWDLRALIKEYYSRWLPIRIMGKPWIRMPIPTYGFLPTEGVNKSQFAMNMTNDMKFSEEQLFHLKSLISFAKQNEIQVFYFILPTKEMLASPTTADLVKRLLYEEPLKEFENVTYLKLDTTDFITKGYMEDDIHLNRFGAEDVTKQVAARMKQFVNRQSNAHKQKNNLPTF